MRGRGRGSKPDGCLLTVACIMGIVMFFLMEHPIIFWLIVVPIVAAVIIGFIRWLKK